LLLALGMPADTTCQSDVKVLDASQQHAAYASAQARRMKRHKKHLLETGEDFGCKVCHPDGRPPKKCKEISVFEPAAVVQEVLPDIPLSQLIPIPTPKKEPTFKEKAERLATVGYSEENAAIVLDMGLQEFCSEIEKELGYKWDQVLYRQKVKTAADLQLSALQQAKRGDWRPILGLFKVGLLSSWNELKQQVTKEEKKTDVNQRIKELDERLSEIRKSEIPPDLPVEMLV